MALSITCEHHGERPAVFTCAHVIQTLTDKIPRGVNWYIDSNGDYQALCDCCWHMPPSRLKGAAQHQVCIDCLAIAAGHNGLALAI